MSFYESMKSPGEEKGGRVAGVAVGIVTNNKDPDGMGRVKVRFPWRDSGDESVWARAAAPMAGKQRGAYFLPEVDDEVLVAFDQGDVEHPFILGALWNGKEKPPEGNSDGRNNIRMIRSRSGHEIVFNDDDQGKKEKIEIRTKAGHLILLDDSSGGEKIEIVDKGGANRISIDSVKNAIAMECGMQMKIKANAIEIQADTTMTLKAGATLTVQGALVKIN